MAESAKSSIFTLVTLAVVLASGGARAEVTIETLALSGQRAPDGRGIIAGFGHGRPFLNNRGQAVFVADVDAPRADMYQHAIIRSDGPGELVQLLRTGQPLPQTNARFGWLHADEAMCVNDSAQVAVYVLSGSRDEHLRTIYRIEADGEVSLVFQPGGEVPGVPNHPIMNHTGQVAFEVGPDDQDPDDRAETVIYRADGPGQLTRLVGQGDRPPVAGFTLSPAISLGSSLTDAGQVSFYAFLNPDDGREGTSEGIFITAGAEIREIARRGVSTGRPDEVFYSWSAVRQTRINERGQVVFYAAVQTRPPRLGAGDSAVFLHTGEGVTDLARRGQGAPDGNGTFQRLGTVPALNDSGQVVMRLGLTGTLQPGRDDHGIFLMQPGRDMVQLVRSGQSAPDGDGVFTGSFSLPAINARGQAAFYAHLSGDGNRGIFVADPDGTVRTIVRVGQTLPEGRVTDVSFAGNEPGRSGFNDAGQVVFHARLEDGEDYKEGVFLATLEQ